MFRQRYCGSVVVIASEPNMWVRLTTRWNKSHPILLQEGINYIYHTGGDVLQSLRDLDRFVSAADAGELEHTHAHELVALELTGYTGTYILVDIYNGMPELSEFVRECYRQAGQFWQITGIPGHTVPYYRHSFLYRVVCDNNNVARGTGRAYLMNEDGEIVYNADRLNVEE